MNKKYSSTQKNTLPTKKKHEWDAMTINLKMDSSLEFLTTKKTWWSTRMLYHSANFYFWKTTQIITLYPHIEVDIERSSCLGSAWQEESSQQTLVPWCWIIWTSTLLFSNFLPLYFWLSLQIHNTGYLNLLNKHKIFSIFNHYFSQISLTD